VKTILLPFLAAVLLLCCTAPAARAQKISALPRTNALSGPATSNLVLVTDTTLGTNGSLAMPLPHFAAVLLPLTSAITNITTNANQFGASTTITVKDGALLTNLVARGLTNFGAFSNSGPAYVGGTLTAPIVGFGEDGRYSWRHSGGIGYLWDAIEGAAPIGVDDATSTVNITPSLNVAGSATVTGTMTASTNVAIAGTNDMRWARMSGGQAAGMLLTLDENTNIVAVMATNAIGSGSAPNVQMLDPGSGLTAALANMTNGGTLQLGAGIYTVTPSLLNSNLVNGNQFTGATLANRTNITILGIPGRTIVDGSSAPGEVLWLTNCSTVFIYGTTFIGWTNHNIMEWPLNSQFLWAGVNFLKCERLTFDTCAIIRHADHGLQDKGAETPSNIASGPPSTNQIIVRNTYFHDIGSFRTNTSLGTIFVDGTSIVPTAMTIENCVFDTVFRGVEPYDENATPPNSQRFFNGIVRNSTFINVCDFGISTAGSTNGHNYLIEGNLFQNDQSWSLHGTNFGVSAQPPLSSGIYNNAGRGWVIRNNTFSGTFTRAIYLFGVHDNVIEGNRIYSITNRSGVNGAGIQLEGTYNARVANNTIESTKDAGIYIFGARDTHVSGNRIANPENEVGIQIATSGIVASNIWFTDNVIVGATNAIWDQDLAGSRKLFFKMNRIQGQTGSGFNLGDTANSEVTRWTQDFIETETLVASNFIKTNGFNLSGKHGWLSTNLQWRLVKMGTLTNVVDVSAAAYYPSNNSFFTVHNNNSGRITEWTLDGVFLQNINGSGSGLVDVEGIVYMGGNKFAIVEEDLNNIYVISITNNAAGSTWTTNNSQMFELPTSIGVDGSGSGVEGIAYDWDRNFWWIAKEKAPAQLIIVTNQPGTANWFTNNWFTTAQMQTFTNANITDFSDLFLDRENQVLWVAQDEGGQFDRVIGISLLTSNIVSIINATNFGQLEGVSITPDGYAILAGEANQFAIYEPVIGGLNSGISWNNFIRSTNTPALPSFNYGASVGPFGVYLTNWFATNITLDFPVIEAQSETNLQFSLAWAANDYEVTVTPPAYTAGVIYSGQPSNGVVYVRGHNYSTTTKDPASGGYRVVVKGWR
jgi:parallel beta-helix repeat protein